jgi:hypothetical protein
MIPPRSKRTSKGTFNKRCGLDAGWKYLESRADMVTGWPDEILKVRLWYYI